MTLGNLVLPTGNNFLKDFPGIHAANLDKIDEFAGACLITHGLKTFTPVLEGTSGTPVIGTGGVAGSNLAYYYEIFNQIYMWGQIRFGNSGASFGGGIYYVTIPFNARSTMGISATFDTSPIVGTGTTYDHDSNAGRLPLTVHLKTENQLQFGIRTNSGSSNRELRSAGYTTWAANDGISWNARLQRLP